MVESISTQLPGPPRKEQTYPFGLWGGGIPSTPHPNAPGLLDVLSIDQWRLSCLKQNIMR